MSVCVGSEDFGAGMSRSPNGLGRNDPVGHGMEQVVLVHVPVSISVWVWLLLSLSVVVWAA